MHHYDIIGDVHGCADKLEGLISKLGYRLRAGVYSHPDRQAVFIGDLIDRGDGHVETLSLVRRMVEAENALIVMGNHEFNAISFATPNPEIPGEFMRPHTDHHRRSHAEFIEQVQIMSGYYAEMIEWFKGLPLLLDLGGLRFVHACWHQRSLEVIHRWVQPGAPLPEDFVVRANQKGTEEHAAIEVVLKGPELNLRKYKQPDFRLPDEPMRTPRFEARIRWWNPAASTLRDLVEIPPGTVTAVREEYPELPDDVADDDDRQYDYTDAIPVFYGHYWRKWNPEKLPDWLPERDRDWTPNTACVDFSAVRGGPLVAYQWDGESTVDPRKYVKYP